MASVTWDRAIKYIVSSRVTKKIEIGYEKNNV